MAHIHFSLETGASLINQNRTIAYTMMALFALRGADTLTLSTRVSIEKRKRTLAYPLMALFAVRGSDIYTYNLRLEPV